uniref:Uncharacterized protein n=1 Tax=Romanomermis culicivorax TaxID=13658 RepID=A0A915LAE4_ROMCU
MQHLKDENFKNASDLDAIGAYMLLRRSAIGTIAQKSSAIKDRSLKILGNQLPPAEKKLPETPVPGPLYMYASKDGLIQTIVIGRKI